MVDLSQLLKEAGEAVRAEHVVAMTVLQPQVDAVLIGVARVPPTLLGADFALDVVKLTNMAYMKGLEDGMRHAAVLVVKAESEHDGDVVPPEWTADGE